MVELDGRWTQAIEDFLARHADDPNVTKDANYRGWDAIDWVRFISELQNFEGDDTDDAFARLTYETVERHVFIDFDSIAELRQCNIDHFVGDQPAYEHKLFEAARNGASLARLVTWESHTCLKRWPEFVAQFRRTPPVFADWYAAFERISLTECAEAQPDVIQMFMWCLEETEATYAEWIGALAKLPQFAERDTTVYAVIQSIMIERLRASNRKALFPR